MKTRLIVVLSLLPALALLTIAGITTGPSVSGIYQGQSGVQLSGRFAGDTNSQPFVTGLGPGLGSAGNAMILTNASTSDTVFLLRLDPLTGPVANTNVCTIQFTTPFAVPPAISITCARATTNFLFTGTTSPTVNADASMTTTSNMTIVVNGTVLTSAGSYIYQVLVFGK